MSNNVLIDGSSPYPFLQGWPGTHFAPPLKINLNDKTGGPLVATTCFSDLINIILKNFIKQGNTQPASGGGIINFLKEY